MSLHRLVLACVSLAFSSMPVLATPVQVDPFTGGLQLWFNAGTITPVATGTPVTTWNDSSGHNNNLSPVYAGQYPTYVASGLNGQPYVSFGTGNLNTALASVNSVPLSLTGNLATTVFIVLEQSSSPANGGGAFGWGTGALGSNAFAMLDNFPSAGTQGLQFGNSQGATFGMYTADTFQILEFQKSPGPINNTTLSINNSSVPIDPTSSAVTASITQTPFLLGQWGDYPFGGLVGGIAEVLVYNTVLSADQSTAVEAYLNAKYFTGQPFVFVPEPGSLVLMGFGGVLLVAACYRRRGSASTSRMTSVRIAVLVLIAATMAAQSAPVSAALVPVYTMGNTQAGVGPNGGVAGLGYDFTTTVPLTIYAVGAFDHLGTDIATNGGGALTVDLYQNSGPGAGTLLLTSPVLSTDPATALNGGAYTSGTDAFRYDTLAVPFLLPAGDYRILSSTNGSSSLEFVFNASGFTPISGFTNDQPVFNFTAGYAATPNPPNVVGDIGPNLLVAQLPEPSTFVLGAVAAMGLLCAGRHRRRKCNA